MSEITKNSAAYIIGQIQNICNEPPGKKQLQKLVYLIEQKGVSLNYEYGLHFYGPYSASLDAETNSLSMNGIIEFDYSGKSHRMSVKNDVAISSELTNSEEEQIMEVIEKFKNKSPSELELLSTAIYAYNNISDKTKENIINGVTKIKGTKYSIIQIEEALKDFAYFDKLLA